MIQETAFSVILWADNSAHWHNQAQKLLNQHYAVQAVADEAAVETAVRSRMPDVIFGDVTMLKRDGFRWLREFRANSRFGGVPVILLATHAQEEICLEGIEAGASDYLLAPFSERELLTRVKVNLTARLRQAAALRESEARFQQIAETIQNVFWMIELPSHRVLYVSPAYESIWGSPRENLYDNPNSWLAVIHPEDRERVQRALADHVRTGGFDQEYRVVRPDGSLRWVRDRGFPIQNKAGQVYRVTGIAEDITDHKQAKASLQQADDRLRQQVSQLEQTNKILHNTLEELQVTEEELRQQNEELAIARELTEVEKFRYQDLFDFAPDGYLVTDANGIIREANQAIATLVKIKPSYLLNTPLAVYISNPDRKAFRNLLFEWHQHPQQQKLQTDALSLNSGGHSIPVAMTGAATRDAQGQIVCIRWLIQNITERKRFEKALFEEKELAQVTLQSIGDAVITTNAQGQVRSLNPVAEHLTGWTTGEAEGLPIAEVFKVVNELTGEPIENPVETVQREGHKVRLSKHLVLIARNGLKYAVDDSAAPIRSSDGQMVGVVLVFHDVTQSRNLARQLSWQATHDALTGLLNRQEFERRLQAAISTAGDEHHTLCYIDLDQFKVVNDTCGHAAGDELLRQLTALLQQRVRTTDTLARLGGDEFGLLLHQCPLPQAEKIADTLRQLIGDFRFSWQGKTFPIGASIGVVTIDETTLNLTGVLSAADAACYAAKEKGRDRIHVYRNNNLELRQHSERQWIAKINRALAENRFQLYCQKIVPITGTEGEYAEILLRLVDGKSNRTANGFYSGSRALCSDASDRSLGS